MLLFVLREVDILLDGDDAWVADETNVFIAEDDGRFEFEAMRSRHTAWLEQFNVQNADENTDVLIAIRAA